MQDKQPLGFTTTLTERDWDNELRGWRCPALKIPGAQVECVFASGDRVDKSWYEVSYELDIVRWVHSERPAQATILIKLTEELSTYELTLKWKKLAIVLPFAASIVVALIAGLFSYFATPTQKSVVASSTNPSAPCNERVKITTPIDLQRVGISQVVEGTFQSLAPEQKIWVLIYPSGIGMYYPQNPATQQTDNTWQATVAIGVKDDAGKEFFIYAVLADKEAQAAFNNYIKQARNENDSPGIPELPKGAQICNHIKVTRK